MISWRASFFFSCGLLLGQLAAVAAPSPPADTSPGRPPNVLLILSDDQAWTDYGFMGHPHIRTPHLDRLAAEGLLFPRGYVPTSLCCPSLATIITGLYPFQHGITGNEPPRPATPGNPYLKNAGFQSDLAWLNDRMAGAPALPRLLQARGYRSFQAGKWWMGSYTTGGFNGGMTHGDPARGGRHGDDGLRIGRDGLRPIFDWIDGTGDQPFFVWYAPFLPHQPHDPPDRLLEHYRPLTPSLHVARYWAMCEWFDETMGELLAHLDRRGLAENTLVAYVTDNGWIQDPDQPRYAPRSKRSPYDGGLRTPILLRWPGHIAPGREDTPVGSIDLAPTILRACGLSPAPNLPGLDLLDREAVRARHTLFGDCHLHNAQDVRNPAANWTYRWCLRDGWKLILPNPKTVPELTDPGAGGPGRIELYQVSTDPLEERDLAAAEPERVRDLAAAIDAWWPAR